MEYIISLRIGLEYIRKLSLWQFFPLMIYIYVYILLLVARASAAALPASTVLNLPLVVSSGRLSAVMNVTTLINKLAKQTLSMAFPIINKISLFLIRDNKSLTTSIEKVSLQFGSTTTALDAMVNSEVFALGLGPYKTTNDPVPFLNRLKQDGKVPHVRYGMLLRKSNGKAPMLNLGGYDSSFVRGKTVPLNDHFVSLYGASINGNQIVISQASSVSVEVSLGFTVLRREIYTAISRSPGMLLNQGFLEFDCSKGKTLGVILLNLNGIDLNLPLLVFGYGKLQNGKCRLHVSPQTEKIPNETLGENVLRNYYTFVDLETRQIGFTMLPEAQTEFQAALKNVPPPSYKQSTEAPPKYQASSPLPVAMRPASDGVCQNRAQSEQGRIEALPEYLAEEP